MPAESPSDAPLIPTATGEPLRHPRWNANTLLATLAVSALLYLGQAVFVPLALAVLLAFVLDPLVAWLRRRGLPRAAAVLLVMAATVLLFAASTLFVAGQVTQLAKNLPTYQSTVQSKLRSLRHQLTEGSRFDATSRMLNVVGGELDAARRDLAGKPPPTAPLQVVTTPAPRTTVQALGDIVEPLLGPLGTAGAVLLFLVLVLIDRHDMRDRLLRLTGADLHLSTDALDDAGQRMSRYLTMQLLVNLSYGVPLGAGLWLIGVPGAPLWGLLGALLRFVPYIGPVVAAVFPLTLAFAVDPGWQMVLWTLALVISLELIVNNLIEPWLYGASTGLSALAIVVSAMCWTLLWGPIGLILATPLTVCLAVLGRHVASLSWLDVLLGSGPVFDQPTRLYQRLLAGDVEEAIELCETLARTDGVLACYSTAAVPALALAARTHTGAEHRHRVSSGMTSLLRTLHHDLPVPDAPARAPGDAGGDRPPRVLSVGARSEIDALAAEMLVHALALDGVPCRLAPATAVSADNIQTLDLRGVDVLSLSVFSSTPEAQVRFIARRLKRRVPGLRIVAGLWNSPSVLLGADAAAQLGVDAVASTLAELVQRVQTTPPGATRTANPATPPTPAPPATPDEERRLEALRQSGAGALALRAALDRAALRAADVFDAPMAMVTLVDAHEAVWQGAAGLDVHAPDALRRHPRDSVLCNLVVTAKAPLYISDADRDPRVAGHAVFGTLGLRCYAGAPLLSGDGHAIGALCVIDTVPRTFDTAEQALLQNMANALMVQIGSAAASEQQHSAQDDRTATTSQLAEGGSALLGGAPTS